MVNCAAASLTILWKINMKKSLLVGALLGTFGVATAQTSVTMYGTVDAGVAYNRGANADGKVLSLQSGQQSYSRIGFRGQEDLGSGMKAIFVLEQGVQIDTGNSGYSTLGSGINGTDTAFGNTGTFSSQAYVGLSSNVGTVKLGRIFSPLYDAYMEIDPFKNGFAANINNTFGNQTGVGSLYQRMSNAIVYNTPDNLYGFKGALAYAFGEQAGSTSNDSQIGASLGYANGPLTIVYAYHHANNYTLGYDVFKTHFIGAAYDFGMLKLHAAFDQNKRNDDSFKTQDYMVGVTVPFGAHSLFADYIHQKNKVRDDANANQFAVGYTYNLSKRTNFYTAYTYVKNNDNASVGTFVQGNSVNTFQIGMRHMF
jgi:predicted porin